VVVLATVGSGIGFADGLGKPVGIQQRDLAVRSVGARASSVGAFADSVPIAPAPALRLAARWNLIDGRVD
jgi:hypothetical protein